MSDDTETLIYLVRDRAYLYDTNHPEFTQKATKAAAWREIAEEMQLSSETVKQKWKNLRDSYVKYLKSLNGYTNSVSKFKNYGWATNLEFLRDTISVQSNVSQSSEIDEDAISDCEIPRPSKKFKPNDVNMVYKYLDNKPVNNFDRIDNLFLSYAETFKKFLPRTQAIVKMEMAQIFGQAELQDLDGQSSLPSSPIDSTDHRGKQLLEVIIKDDPLDQH